MDFTCTFFVWYLLNSVSKNNRSQLDLHKLDSGRFSWSFRSIFYILPSQIFQTQKRKQKNSEKQFSCWWRRNLRIKIKIILNQNVVLHKSRFIGGNILYSEGNNRRNSFNFDKAIQLFNVDSFHLRIHCWSCFYVFN